MINKPSIVVLYATTSSKEEADKIASDLVLNKLVACCNQVENISSTFFWEGKVCSEREVLLIMKSRESLISKIAQRVKELHSYQVPEVIAMPVIGGSA